MDDLARMKGKSKSRTVRLICLWLVRRVYLATRTMEPRNKRHAHSSMLERHDAVVRCAPMVAPEGKDLENPWSDSNGSSTAKNVIDMRPRLLLQLHPTAKFSDEVVG